MKRVQQGFTLIELMIVVAIIGILAAVAIPQYQDYVIRTKLAKVNVAVEPVKMAIAMFAQENGGLSSLPASGWGSLGLQGAPGETTEVSGITVNAGTASGGGDIVAAIRNIGTGYDGTNVTYTPAVGSTAVTWSVVCSDATSAHRSNLAKAFGC